VQKPLRSARKKKTFSIIAAQAASGCCAAISPRFLRNRCKSIVIVASLDFNDRWIFLTELSGGTGASFCEDASRAFSCCYVHPRNLGLRPHRKNLLDIFCRSPRILHTDPRYYSTDCCPLLDPGFSRAQPRVAEFSSGMNLALLTVCGYFSQNRGCSARDNPNTPNNSASPALDQFMQLHPFTETTALLYLASSPYITLQTIIFQSLYSKKSLSLFLRKNRCQPPYYECI
jgi:hypothetical protein